MRLYVDRFYAFLARPLFTRTRWLLVLLVVPLLLSFAYPLWRITMEAPQYPNGLELDIYAYKLEGGNGGQHLQEINTLNHYIGMRSLDREALGDLDWIPFALGGLAIFTLRVAAIGLIPDARMHGSPRQRLERERRDEPRRCVGHHDVRFASRLRERAHNRCSFVNGDAAANADSDPASLEGCQGFGRACKHAVSRYATRACTGESAQRCLNAARARPEAEVDSH